MLREGSAYNYVKIIGNVVSDPKVVGYGNTVTLVVKTRDGEFHRIAAKNEWFGVASNVKKGEIAHVEGALRTRKWTGNMGETHYTTEVHAENFFFERGDERMFAVDFPPPPKPKRVSTMTSRPSFSYRGDALDFGHGDSEYDP